MCEPDIRQHCCAPISQTFPLAMRQFMYICGVICVCGTSNFCPSSCRPHQGLFPPTVAGKIGNVVCFSQCCSRHPQKLMPVCLAHSTGRAFHSQNSTRSFHSTPLDSARLDSMLAPATYPEQYMDCRLACRRKIKSKFAIDVTAGNCTNTTGRLCEGSLSMIVSLLWLHGFSMCRGRGWSTATGLT